VNLDESARQELNQALGARPDALSGADALRAQPLSTVEVAAVVGWANQHGQRLYPTSSGRSAVVGEGLLLDLSGLNAIGEVNREDMLAVVQPGVQARDLAAASAKVGLEYPPAFLAAPGETIGGALARGAGMRSRLAGPHRDYALGLRVVFGTGEQASVGSRAVKNQTGYNLTQHVIGSWGALAIITEATLRLTPARSARRTCVVAFGSVRRAAEAAVSLAASSAAPELVELVDRATAEAGGPVLARALGSGETWLLVRLEGLREAGVAERADAIVAAAPSASVLDADASESVWSGYRAATHAVRGNPPSAWLTVGLPLTAVAATMDTMTATASRHGVTAAWSGGVGFGAATLALHGSPESGEMVTLVREIVALMRAVGGGVSGCSSLGLDYDGWLGLLMPAANAALLRAAKAALDPNGVLRPLLG
jgi:FAD/FMN-containing dehydrogenase